MRSCSIEESMGCVSSVGTNRLLTIIALKMEEVEYNAAGKE